MPWKECNQMDERLKFIARLLDGDKMAVLCRQIRCLNCLAALHRSAASGPFVM